MHEANDKLGQIMPNKDILMTAKARTAKISNGLSKITYMYKHWTLKGQRKGI